METYILLLKKASRDICGAVSGYVSGHVTSRMNALVSSRSPICFREGNKCYSYKVKSLGSSQEASGKFLVDFNNTDDSTHSELKRHWTDFLETFIPLVDGAKSLQLHLWLNERGKALT